MYPAAACQLATRCAGYRLQYGFRPLRPQDFQHLEIPVEGNDFSYRWIGVPAAGADFSCDSRISRSFFGRKSFIILTKTDTPLDAGLALLEFNAEHLKSELVAQDVLILNGEEDHFILLKMHQRQVDALVNAKLIMVAVFTEKDQGQNHCQVGIIGLAL